MNAAGAPIWSGCSGRAHQGGALPRPLHLRPGSPCGRPTRAGRDRVSNTLGASQTCQAVTLKMAFDPRLIDDLARRLAGSVPEGMVALRRDLEQNFKVVLQSGLSRFDLVTREEFDVQAAVLKRTREKLAALEQRLAALEKPR